VPLNPRRSTVLWESPMPRLRAPPRMYFPLSGRIRLRFVCFLRPFRPVHAGISRFCLYEPSGLVWFSVVCCHCFMRLSHRRSDLCSCSSQCVSGFVSGVRKSSSVLTDVPAAPVHRLPQPWIKSSPRPHCQTSLRSAWAPPPPLSR